MAEPMTLTIITPDAIVYDGKADFFVGHAIDGEFGVLPNHAPMIIALDMSPLRVDNPDGQQHTFAVFGGFVEIEHNKVSIVTPSISIVQNEQKNALKAVCLTLHLI